MKRPFTFGDVCSGIGVAEIAAEPLGWKNAFVSEIDPAPCYVLNHRRGASRPRYMPDPDEPGITPKEKRARRANLRRVNRLPADCPGPQNFGDFTQIKAGEHDPIDLLIGGTPCQDFSIAGKRAGLDGDRGNLTLEYGRLARRSRTRWIVWENVPGVFSNNEGRDFAAVLGMFTGQIVGVPTDGWRNSGVVPAATPEAFGVAWHVLDAQYVRVDGLERAVPQRRRRVIIVGHLGDWRRAAAVLFDLESLRGDSPPRRSARKDAPESSDASSDIGRIPEVSHALDASRGGDSGKSQQRSYVPEILRQALTSKIAKGSSGPTGDEHHHLVAHSLRADGYDASEDGSGRGTPIVPVLDRETVPTLDANYGKLHGASHNDANHGHGHLVPMGFMPARTLAPDGGVDSRFAERDVADAVHSGTGSGNKAPVIAFGHTDADPTMRMDVAPTLRSMQHDQSHANGGSSIAVAIQERAISMSEGTTSGPDGSGVRDDGTSFTLENRHTVQAVAFESRVARNGRGAPEEVSQPLKAESGTSGKGDAAPLVAASAAGDPAWQVRRLMPIECERLQGVPEVRNSVIIEICEDEKPDHAKSAGQDIPPPKPGQSGPVLAHVLIDLERRHLQLHSLERCLLSASIAEAHASSIQAKRLADFALALAAMPSILAPDTIYGKAASQKSMSPFIIRDDGKKSVRLYGFEINELASDAEKFTSALAECTKSITSGVGQGIRPIGSDLKTLFSCATVAIASFIPNRTLTATSYSLEIEISGGYTLVPFGNKPMADGPRYKMLGNAYPVNMIRWIFRRIDMMEQLIEEGKI